MVIDQPVRFDAFRLDRRTGLARLAPAGGWEPVPIGSRALGVLGLLVTHQGELVSKDEIMQAVWPGTVVEESNLSVQVSALRRALDEGRVGGSCIQTVPGRGYKFVAESTAAGPAPPAELALPAEPAIPVAAVARASAARPWRAMVAAAMLFWAGAAGALLGAASPEFGRPLPAAYSPQDRRQSLVIVPFAGTETLAATLTREVTDAISSDVTMPVTPAATAHALRGATIDVRALGRTLDVHFVVTGHVRQDDGRTVLSVTLYETAQARPVLVRSWEEATGPDTPKKLAYLAWAAVDTATTVEDAARALREHPDRLDKRDLMFAAARVREAGRSEGSTREQLQLVDRALALDPDYPFALRRKAWLLNRLVIDGWSDDPAAALASAELLVDRAIMLSDGSRSALRTKASVLRSQGRLPEAAALLRRLTAAEPWSVWLTHELGIALLSVGQDEEALRLLLQAKRLVSDDRPIDIIDSYIAMALVATGQNAAAIERAQMAIQSFPSDSGWIGEYPWLALIAAQAASGDEAGARDTLRRFLAQPRRLSNVAAVKATPQMGANAALQEGLRRAGMAPG